MTNPAQIEGYCCDECHDSGYIELVSGGLWDGIGSRRLVYCKCLCGADARRQDLLTGNTIATEDDRHD